MIDPASPEFARLDHRTQARVLRGSYGWSVEDLADELGCEFDVIMDWLADLPRRKRVRSEAQKAAQLERQRVYCKTEQRRRQLTEYQKVRRALAKAAQAQATA